MKTLRQIVALLVMVMTVFASSTAFAASLQDEVLYYVNVERVAAGVQPLTAAVNLNALVSGHRKRVSYSLTSVPMAVP